jgi:quercetin dioxygenase-like cupin family protein
MNATNEAAPPEPQVHDLKGMLEYQDKSVVSRMLAKNSGGSVTLFAFDAGEGLSEHTAPFDALVVGVDGQAEIPVGGRPFTLRAGESLLLPAGIPHAVNPVGRFKMLLVMIRGDRKAATVKA